MIRGTVTSELVPVVRLRVFGRHGQSLEIAFEIDTGFNGFLLLDRDAIQLLDLRPIGLRDGTLADGTVELFPAFLATVDWHGAVRTGAVIQSGGGNMLGMKLLEGSVLQIEVFPSGSVEVFPRSPM
jgi:clan AA aspartic protease